ncbi:MAG: alpha/beta fold hydrolase [Gemmatimonadaceae bacterium]
MKTIFRCAVVALVAAAPLSAQAPERAVFLVRLGLDTLAVETATWTAARADATLRLRTPIVKLDRHIAFTPSGDVREVESVAGYGIAGDSARTRAVITVQADSGHLRVEPAGGAPVQELRFAMPSGAVPFTNLSGQTLELALRRARASRRDTSDVPLLLSNGQSLRLRVTRLGADSAVLSISGVDIRARTDAVGHFLGAVIPSQGATFERLDADSPVAAWMPVRPSYAAPANAPYVAEDLVVRTPAGIVLAGTLTMPKHAAGARMPAVVLITGSGAQDRDEAIPSLGNYHPFREIADSLSRRGIAVLRLDDRGIGGSAAGPASATSADYADDIRAALALLRARADVDPARLGLVGHSEGGLIAPMIAARDSTLRAIVLVAGPAKTGREILAFQRRQAIAGDTSIAPAARDSVFARATEQFSRTLGTTPWVSFFEAYDPLPTARLVRARTLILQGETDRQVTAEQASMLADAMRKAGNRHVMLRTFPRMNHLMLDDASGDPAGYKSLSSYGISRAFLGALTEWLVANL